MKKFKRLLSIIFSVFSAICIVMAAFFAVSKIFHLPGGYKLYSVASGSMEPVMPVGNLIITKKPPSAFEITKDMIISFKEPGNEKRVITHRVHDIKFRGTELGFVTKGDANLKPDDWVVPYKNITGVFYHQVPKIGYLYQFLQSPWGIILLVVLPIVLLVSLEIQNIVKILVDQKVEEELKKRDPPKASGEKFVQLGVILLALIMIVAVGPAYALLQSTSTTMTGFSLSTGVVANPSDTDCNFEDINLNLSNSNTPPDSTNTNSYHIEQHKTVTSNNQSNVSNSVSTNINTGNGQTNSNTNTGNSQNGDANIDISIENNVNPSPNTHTECHQVIQSSP